MKKSKKLKKDLSRLGSYLKKETARLEKLTAHAAEADGSTAEVWARLQDRQRAACADLDAIRAALAALKAEPKPATNGASRKTGATARARKGTRMAQTGEKTAAPLVKKAAGRKTASRSSAKAG